MKFLVSFLAAAALSAPVCAQLQVDQPIELTGADGDRMLTNLEAPVDGTDAVNKNYVDNAVAATGGGAPSMLSAESPSAMHLGDAIRYCRNLAEDGFSDWRLPNYQEFIAAASFDETVSSDTSTNFCHIGAVDTGSLSLGTNTGATNYAHMGIRLSDGARSNDYTGSGFTYPSYYTRCVR
jgi:hypothetical protein